METGKKFALLIGILINLFVVFKCGEYFQYAQVPIITQQCKILNYTKEAKLCQMEKNIYGNCEYIDIFFGWDGIIKNDTIISIPDTKLLDKIECYFREDDIQNLSLHFGDNRGIYTLLCPIVLPLSLFIVIGLLIEFSKN